MKKTPSKFVFSLRNQFSAILVFLLFLSVSAKAQTWSRMQSWGLDLESVHWINDQEGIAVGEKLIIRTQNGGTSWEEILQPFTFRFSDVVFFNSGRGVAVGEKGEIWTTEDRGITWQRRSSGTSNDLLGVTKTSETELIAVGKNGEIRLSSDLGITWSKVEGGTSLNLNDISFAAPNTTYISADDGRILKSIDKGKTWVLSTLPRTNDLFGIAFSSELIGYAVGENGAFERTIDGGQSWISSPSGTTNTLRKLAFSPLDVRIVVAVGDLATVLRSTNSGVTITRINLGATANRKITNSSFRPGSNLQTAVGQDGYLLASPNAGAGWTQTLAGIRNQLTSVDFKNQTTGFISGQNGTVFVTSNSGTSLINRPIPEQIPVVTIDFWNTGFGYSSSPLGKMYRTGNTGSSWIPVFNPAGRTIEGFYLFAPSVLYVAGAQGYISRSFDSGVTWDQTVISNTTTNLKDVTFFDFVFGFAIGENGQISWSSGGNQWENLPKLTNQNLNALAKLDTTKAIIVGNGGIILKTEDKARTWKKVESGTLKNLLSVDFFDQRVGFASGEDGIALVSVDGGETWVNSPTGTLRDLTGVSAGTDTRAYFVGEDGTLLTYNCIPPVGTLGAITGEALTCLGTNTYQINAQPVAGSEILWRIDGGIILSGQGTSKVEVQWTSTGRNAVLVSRTNFCGSGETSSLEVSVDSTPPSNVNITGQGSTCTQTSYRYSLPAVTGTTYNWTATGGEITQGQGTAQVDVKWNQSGSQTLSVIRENRCGKAAPVSLTVTVKSPPNQPSIISGEALTGLVQQTYSVEAVPGLDYKWTLPANSGKILSGQGSNRIVVSWETEGNFELAVEAQNECNFGPKRVLAVNVNVITSIEPEPDQTLIMYPNPSQGNLTLASSDLDQWTRINVFNAMGQMVQSWNTSIGQKELRLEGLPRGLVIIRLEGKKGFLSKKIWVR